MKTFIKTIRTITAVLMILVGLLALFTIDNAQDITSLLLYAMTMIMGLAGGIYLLILTYPELTDLSEFDDKSLNSLEDYQKELEVLRERNLLLREHNLLLVSRYLTFKGIIKSHKSSDYSEKTPYPNIHYLLYVEDLTITEDEFIYYIKQMFLGDDWFIEDPISPSQINTIAFCDIYRMYKHPSLLFWKMFKDKLKRMLLKW